MKLIDASAKITENLYDNEHDKFCQKETTVEKHLDFYTAEGCPEAVEAIPVEWIEEYIKWMKTPSNGYSTLAAMHIESMVKKWKEEQQ